MDHIIIKNYASPCGELLLGSLGSKLCMCDWTAGGRADATAERLGRLLDASVIEGTSAVIEHAADGLDEYFQGLRREFPLDILAAGTPFRKAVWQAIMSVPYGRCISYSQLAESIGRPSAVRAVAAATGANALSVVIPCHRIIGASGELTGYAGGLDAKRFLLRLEREAMEKGGRHA